LKDKKMEIKKRAFLLFHVAAFLFITIFFILPYLVQISTYFHEKSHQAVLNRYGVESSYRVNLLETIPNFFNPRIAKLGVTKFNTEQYMKLDRYKKTEVNMAGVISDLRFLFLIAIYLALVNIYTFYKVRVKKDYNLIGVLAVNWILFMWLLALIQITVANLTANGGDLLSLIRILG